MADKMGASREDWMRKLVLGLGLALLATPALAEWQMVEVSDPEIEAYKAYVVDHTGAIELQFYCDSEFPGLLDMTVYTAEDFEPKTSYAPEGDLAVLIDGEVVNTVTAFYDDHDGELLIFTSDFDIEGVDQIAMAMAKAGNEIGLTYFDRSYAFPAEAAKGIIKSFLNTCPSE
jgi:hypothetical protein